jgi:sugar diacid utilization regulator
MKEIMNATAAQLYLHRNTVKYRINKINECFSPDLIMPMNDCNLLISGMIDP